MSESVPATSIGTELLPAATKAYSPTAEIEAWIKLMTWVQDSEAMCAHIAGIVGEIEKFDVQKAIKELDPAPEKWMESVQWSIDRIMGLRRTALERAGMAQMRGVETAHLEDRIAEATRDKVRPLIAAAIARLDIVAAKNLFIAYFHLTLLENVQRAGVDVRDMGLLLETAVIDQLRAEAVSILTEMRRLNKTPTDFDRLGFTVVFQNAPTKALQRRIRRFFELRENVSAMGIDVSQISEVRQVLQEPPLLSTPTSAE